ncbi:hypothetical protein Lupro_08380 [Lutibacter profundi]|uniref:Attractin/MKLN-like beta-propeller domain-containing protein n=1 Tax=Lutibacter profundi TaxID=1622118 RepID=A0A0X8G748_9FLAO|nr:hypothetical protein [Lutibacter profundi]AMC11269.1 hypothetical protein Lupro_08380 [Lutibacter profundi]
MKTLEYYPDLEDFTEFLNRAGRAGFSSMHKYNNDLQLYDIKNDSWIKLKSKFKKRAYHNLNFYNHKIYVVGGKNISANGKFEYLDDKIEVFDVDKDIVIIDNTNPHQAVNFASFTYKGNIIVMGGSIKKKNNGFKEYSNKVDLYDIKTGNWYQLGNMPIAKEVKGVLIEDKIYLVGSFNKKPLASIESFDLTTQKWKKEGNLFYGIGKPAITHKENLIYLFNDGKISTYNVLTKELNAYLIDLFMEAPELYYYDYTYWVVLEKIVIPYFHQEIFLVLI